jgi:hypothetical protein
MDSSFINHRTVVTTHTINDQHRKKSLWALQALLRWHAACWMTDKGSPSLCSTGKDVFIAQQGCVIRSFGTLNTVNTCWIRKLRITKNQQILHPYYTARFVQYGKMRFKYDTAYYTNTPYDTSLLLDKWVLRFGAQLVGKQTSPCLCWTGEDVFCAEQVLSRCVQGTCVCFEMNGMVRMCFALNQVLLSRCVQGKCFFWNGWDAAQNTCLALVRGAASSFENVRLTLLRRLLAVTSIAMID